jgi:hypothetical protein
MLHIKESQKYQNIFINAYLTIYSIWLIITFLDTTMFHINYPDFTYIVLLEITVIFVGIKMILFDKHSKVELWLCIFLIISFGGSFINSGYGFLLPVLFLILGAKNVPFKKLLQIYCAISGTLIIITVIASQTGLVENLIYKRNGQRISFGFNYPTDFTAHIFFFFMGYCYLRKESLSYLELIGILGLGIFSYIFCGARTNFLCLLLTFLVFLFLKIHYNISYKKDIIHTINPIFSKVLVFSMPICALCIFVLTLFYHNLPSSIISTTLNSMMSGRLNWYSVGLDRYGIKIFGSAFTMIGNGGSTEPVTNYFFLDSSYILLLIRYGIMIFLSVIVIFLINSVQAHNNKNYYLLLILTLIAIQCIMEHHLLEIAYNPFMFFILSDNGTNTVFKFE